MGHFGNQDYTPLLPPDGARLVHGLPDEDDLLDHRDIRAAMAKRPVFLDSIRPALEDQERRADRIRVVNGPGGMPMVVAICGSCSAPGALENMHLGHRQTWADYVTDKAPRTLAAIAAAYNDLANLKLEHSTCNVSHIFEKLTEGEDLTEDDRDVLSGHDLFKNLDDDALAEVARSDIFDSLRRRNEETEATEGLTVEIGGREVVLGHVPNQRRKDVPVDPYDMKRPDFLDQTRGALLGVWQSAGWVEDTEAGRHFRCGSCGLWGEGHSMQLGHVTDWRAHLSSFGDITARQAVLLYNDLKNLKFEHPMCNQGHEWEELATLSMPAEVARQWAEANGLLTAAVSGGTAQALDFRLESRLNALHATAQIDLTAQLELIRTALAEREEDADGPVTLYGLELADAETADRLQRIIRDDGTDMQDDGEMVVGGQRWSVDQVKWQFRQIAEIERDRLIIDAEEVGSNLAITVLETAQGDEDEIDALVDRINADFADRAQTWEMYGDFPPVTADQVRGILALSRANRRAVRTPGRSAPPQRPAAPPVDFAGFSIDAGVVKAAERTLADERKPPPKPKKRPVEPDPSASDPVVPRRRIAPTLIDPEPASEPKRMRMTLPEDGQQRLAQAYPQGLQFLRDYLFDTGF